MATPTRNQIADWPHDVTFSTIWWQILLSYFSFKLTAAALPAELSLLGKKPYCRGCSVSGTSVQRSRRMTADSWILNGDSVAAAPMLNILGKEMVLPASPSPPRPFFLSCLDIFWQDVHYNRRLLFYLRPTRLSQNVGAIDGLHLLQSGVDDGLLPPQNGADDGLLTMTHDRIQQLKSSLAVCLIHYFPWCGRLAKDANPPHRLFIDCNDAGVEFVQASIDMPLSLLGQDGFQMKPFFDDLCQRPDHKGDCLFSSPLLSIQATSFSDGGLALGIAQSHVVADGQSLWDFMVSWGECSRGVPLSLPPVHDRLAVQDPSLEKATWSLSFEVSEEDKVVEEDPAAVEADSSKADAIDGRDSAKVDHLRTLDEGTSLVSKKSSCDVESASLRSESTTLEARNEDNNTCFVNAQDESNLETKSSENGGKIAPNPEPLVQFMFTLSGSTIKQLKSEAGEGFTSFEVTCAHFWKQTSFARKAPAGEITYFFAPISFRSRIAPPLPHAYFGNVVGMITALSTAGKIRREPLQATASRIHEKVNAVREDVVQAFMNWLEMHDNRFMSGGWDNVPVMKGLNVASSPHFPAYKVDFGWGKPTAVRAVKVTGDGELVFFGGRPGSKAGDVEICTALPSDVLKHLLQDSEFLPKPPTSSFD
ncbi:hypothetical protein L7F22_055607 [Adiantum nelumboides]|nr:hypothetical protein [Adiantum nelumboides]